MQENDVENAVYKAGYIAPDPQCVPDVPCHYFISFTGILLSDRIWQIMAPTGRLSIAVDKNGGNMYHSV